MPIDSNSSTTIFESPAAQVDALEYPDDLREQVKDVYAQTLPDGQTGGMEVTGIHITLHQLSSLETEGEWEEKEGWVVIQCGLTGTRFAIPEGEPSPTLTTEYQFADGKESAFHRPVHPEVAADQSKAALHLVAKVARNIPDRLMDLIGMAAQLEALSEMDELPKAIQDEPDGSGHSACEYETIDPLP